MGKRLRLISYCFSLFLLYNSLFSSIPIYSAVELKEETQEGIVKYKQDKINIKVKQLSENGSSKRRSFSADGSGINLEKYGILDIEKIEIDAKGEDINLFGEKPGKWFNATLRPGLKVKEVIALLEEDSLILLAEPDYIREVEGKAVPVWRSDPGLIHQWYLDKAGITDAWNYLHSKGQHPGGNRDVIVAVIDTGVDYLHPDLQGNMWINPREIIGNGIDDDGNGYVDDIYGIDTVNKTGNPLDNHGHGTHVAGIIGAMGHNNEGGVGVAFNVQIMAVKAAQSNGKFTSSDVAKAINYAINMGADVINMSFGGYGRSTLEEEALQRASESAVLVAAAGNDGINNEPRASGKPTYPASYSWVLGVMAQNQSPDGNGDNLASFSNWDMIPQDSLEYEIMAPGVDIYSTLPNGEYEKWSGTSMATPVVAGVAALLRSQFPDKHMYSSRFIMERIASTGGLKQGKTYSPIAPPTEYRELNAYKAITNTPRPETTYQISGRVNYFKDNRPVADTVLKLEGDKNYTKSTNNNGEYTLLGIGTGNYKLYPSKNDQSSDISAYDASLILQHTVKRINLDSHQQIAADVNQNGEINSIDSSYILEHVVGLLKTPFPGAGSMWKFSPNEKNIGNITRDLMYQNFTGILLGDVSGNWGTGTGIQSLNNVKYSVGSGDVNADETVLIPIEIDQKDEGIYAIEITISYNKDMLVPISIGKTDLSRDFALASNIKDLGQIKIALAGDTPIASNGDFVNIKFQAMDIEGAVDLIISDAKSNEDKVTNTINGLVNIKQVANEAMVQRLYGKDRIETAIKVSKEAYPTAGIIKTAILAGYKGEVDALTGTLLAADKDAPLLLTHPKKVVPELKAELRRLGVDNIHILGGEKVINKSVETELRGYGYNVNRISGSNREETAIKIAKKVNDKAKHVFLAKGYDVLADALAIGSVSAKHGIPVLLTQTHKLAPQTLAAMKDLGVTHVTIVGGEAAVSKAVEVQLREYIVDRIEESNREETALAIARKYFKTSDKAIIANGYTFADALVGGYFGALNDAPILLTQQKKLTTSIKNDIESVYILGGTSAISEEVFKEIESSR